MITIIDSNSNSAYLNEFNCRNREKKNLASAIKTLQSRQPSLNPDPEITEMLDRTLTAVTRADIGDNELLNNVEETVKTVAKAVEKLKQLSCNSTDQTDDNPTEQTDAHPILLERVVFFCNNISKFTNSLRRKFSRIFKSECITKYIFLPCCDGCHWYLVFVVGFPAFVEDLIAYVNSIDSQNPMDTLKFGSDKCQLFCIESMNLSTETTKTFCDGMRR